MFDYDVPGAQIDLSVLPAPLLTSEPGSFAQHTCKVRIPHIIDETLGHNHFAPDIEANLSDLRAEITDGQIRQLRELAPDAAFWHTVSAPFVGRSWLDAPWYWAEAYFYRRLLEATRYFQPGAEHGFDPFSTMKSAEWQPSGAPRVVEELLSALPADDEARFTALVRASLWGNRIDLSYRSVAGLGIAHGASANLLIDDTDHVRDLLWRRPVEQVIVVNDNAGTELAMDLALADFLLDSGRAETVVLQLKGQPFFVSDALPADVQKGLDSLATGAGRGAALADRLNRRLAAGRLLLRTHWFYTTSLFYFQLPADLRGELATAGLVIVKGDANYRRLFGDAHWPTTTAFAAASAYFPAPLLALRTLKSEIVLGLPPGEAERLSEEDPAWLVNGQRGVIQANLGGGGACNGHARVSHKMNLRPFAIERYFAKYEFRVGHLLSASDPESLTLQELLTLADPQSLALWQELRLSYTESQGHPLLREAIAQTYSSIERRDVLAAVPEEAIFIAMNCLLRPGDHVIATFPAYQSLYEIAGSLGGRLTRWPLSQNGERWELDLNFLADHLADDTRLIIINFPHNPTGFLAERAALDTILDLARRRGIYVFSDEMYRRLEYAPERRLPAVCELYERGISLAGLSKAFGLPGLRLGWLATVDRELLARCAAFKDYTTICGSAPGEILGIMALRAGEQIIARNLAIIQANLGLADEFFLRQRARFTWLRPGAGSVCLPRLLGDRSVAALCKGLLENESVLLLPGEVFEFGDGYFRLGLGRRDFPQALARLDAYLDRN